MDVTISCPCPGTPHQGGDTVTLRDKPTLHMGTTALGWAGMDQGSAPTAGEIAELYLREGIVSWTLVEEDGSPRLVDDDGIQFLLDDYAVAYPVAEAAAAVYTDIIFAPLVSRLSNSSRTGPTARRTSASSRRSPKAPSP